MDVTVELSMYPFNEDYKPLITDFIARLNAGKGAGFSVDTGPTATLICGPYAVVMTALQDIIAWSQATHGRAVFVAKIIPGFNAAESGGDD